MVSVLQIYSGLLPSFFEKLENCFWAGFYSAGTSSSTSVQAHMGVIVSTALTVLKGRLFSDLPYYCLFTEHTSPQ